jgi:hypothetical protein
MRRHLARSSRYRVAAVLIAIGLPACAPRQGPTSAAPAPAATAARASALIVDPERPAHFKYAGGGLHYLCAAGDPEGFLYRGTRNADGTRAGDQQALIQKIAPTGANGIYVMAVRSHGGDGAADENPFVDSDPTRGLDEDILNQWDTWFSAMDAAGVVIYFFFYDDSARVWRTGDQVGPEERAFFETLVRRYKHHRHLVWVIGEEYSEGLSRRACLRWPPSSPPLMIAVIRSASISSTVSTSTSPMIRRSISSRSSTTLRPRGNCTTAWCRPSERPRDATT